jgi:DNA-binding beta-propeller fold protein YncE
MAIAAAGVVIAVAVGGDLLLGGGGKSSPPAAFPAPCSARAAAAFTTARPLSCVHPRWTAVKGRPFDAAAAGHFAFVSYGNGFAVINTAKSPPETIHRIPLASAQGEALTLDDKYLLVSGGSGAAVFKVSDLIRGEAHPVKLLNSPGGRHAVEVAVTPDGRFAFITLQHSNQVAVFDLSRALASPAYESAPVLNVQVGPNPIGIAAAPDGRYLYVATGLAGNCKTSAEGSLVVLDATKAEGKAPGPPIMQEVDTESGLARVITSPDGKFVWATAGCGNTLQAYSAAKLIHDPNHAQIAQVHVGQAPLGLVMVDQGRRIVLADSDRYHAGARSNLVLIDVAKARANRPAILGIIESGKVPRQFALTPDGKTLLVTNTNSENVEVINVRELS